ncbi:MAG TPA: dihydropteroate synthase [candidate division Zixibacteria bacterium]|nr:dihydropteroate synthase [candidate division Zixibacteria bacterium]
MKENSFKKNNDGNKVIRLSRGRQITLTRPHVMGILNVTPDSFSDGGLYATVDKAVEHALRMEEQGADIIDIGGESTRPGAEPVEEEVELQRVIPVIERLRDLSDIPISIDTYKSSVASAALKAGADIVNDISAMRFDTNMVSLMAKSGAPVVLMHMQGTPKEMQINPHYDDCVTEICDFFERRINLAEQHGIAREQIIIDPGIGFGKRLEDNLHILARFGDFCRLKVPVMIAASRKSFIGMLHDSERLASDRLGGSIAAAVIAVMDGASLVRAHDVPETVEALKVVQGVRSKL